MNRSRAPQLAPRASEGGGAASVGGRGARCRQLEVVGRTGLRVGAAVARVSPQQARLLCALVARLGEVVSRETLMRAAEVEGSAERREHALDVALSRLRARLSRLGCELEVVRGVGARLAPAIRLRMRASAGAAEGFGGEPTFERQELRANP